MLNRHTHTHTHTHTSDRDGQERNHESQSPPASSNITMIMILTYENLTQTTWHVSRHKLMQVIKCWLRDWSSCLFFFQWETEMGGVGFSLSCTPSQSRPVLSIGQATPLSFGILLDFQMGGCSLHLMLTFNVVNKKHQSSWLVKCIKQQIHR